MTSRVGRPDTDADRQLRDCLDKSPLTSFIMIAGAGSGKTTSLIKALDHIKKTRGDQLSRRGQKVACVTYTEVAEKEILTDVGNSSLFHVSTIHSFLWAIIKPFQNDIKSWVETRLNEKIAECREKIDKPRTQQRTREKAIKDIERYTAQIELLLGMPRFTYGVGSDYSRGILGHDDIIRMVPALIKDRALLRALVARRFPFVFVDESQDTSSDVVEALKAIDEQMSGQFCLGFFGDPMQKIYATGVGQIIPGSKWTSITKPENFRCPLSVLSVINNIRTGGDRLIQTPGRTEERGGGHVKGTARIFILPADIKRDEHLNSVQVGRAKLNADPGWNDKEHKSKVRILVIVHRMVAKRLGFADLYGAMNDKAPPSFKEGFLDGTIWTVRIFLAFLLPLADAFRREGREFEVMNLLREYCPLLFKDRITGADLPALLKQLKANIEQLVVLLADDSDTSVFNVLKFVHDHKLANLDERLLSYLETRSTSESLSSANVEEEEGSENECDSISKYLDCPVKQFWGYRTYIENESAFSTQQGIKGAEFERVLTILDDEEGTHIQFSYDKYFELTPLSATDIKNEQEGKETTVSRTRRLFYVCCSRALQDLAVVLFTQNVASAVEAVKKSAIFPVDQIYQLSDLLARD